MNEVVECELVDLARVEPGEAVTDSFEQGSELLLVIRGNQLARGSTLRLLTAPRWTRLAHDQTLQLRRRSMIVTRQLGVERRVAAP